MTIDEISWKPWYRGRFTVAIEEIESTDNMLVLRAWTTKWDEVFEWMQKGGTSIALLGVLGITPLAFVAMPFAFAAAVAVFVGGTTAYGASAARDILRRTARKRTRRGKPLDVVCIGRRNESYRESSHATLQYHDREIELRQMVSMTLVDLPPAHNFRWGLIIQLEDEVIEPFPPYLGAEKEILPFAKEIAERCGVPLAVIR